MDRIEKTHKELDWDAVDFRSGGGMNWSWGRGGYPYRSHEWGISHYQEVNGDIVETRYKMPQVVNEMLQRTYQSGINDKERAIKVALGLL
jgi:hypothetical protein